MWPYGLHVGQLDGGKIDLKEIGGEGLPSFSKENLSYHLPILSTLFLTNTINTRTQYYFGSNE